MLAVVLALVVSPPVPAAAQAPAGPGAHPAALVDVPYLSQTPELCGGAALAMVFRYWGDRDVFAQDFAALVNRAERGIRADVLAAAARARGWQALTTHAKASAGIGGLASHLSRGRPVIALIEERPDVFHYVVVLGVTPSHVVVHDPARAPFRTLARGDFERRWSATSGWMMLVLPSPAAAENPTLVNAVAPVRPTNGTSAPCAAMVRRSVRLFQDGDAGGAEDGLRAAADLCPADAAVWRELAGLRLVQSRWTDARRYAEQAARLAPDDAEAWELVATTRFVQDDRAGALTAWNRMGRPLIDTISVGGTVRTRHPVIVRLTGLEPRQLLTPEAFARAARRLDELPAAAATTLNYLPGPDGAVALEAIVREPDVWPSGFADWGAIGARALLKNELVVDVAGPTGAGEVWTASWRWAANRPRVGIELALPAPRGSRGIVTVDALWERQTYVAPLVGEAGPEVFRTGRRRGGLSMRDWLTSRLRWTAGAALDEFGRDRYVAAHGGVDVRLAGDRGAVLADGGTWTPIGERRAFHRLALLTTWRTTPGRPTSWQATMGVAAVSRHAPPAVWPAGDTATHRDALLRAHPLHDDGVVAGTVFGRRVAYLSAEHHRSVYEGRFGHTDFVGFVDAARAWRRAAPSNTRDWHVDVGVGFRHAASRTGGAVRLDVAYGLRDGNRAMSAGWVRRWPDR